MKRALALRKTALNGGRGQKIPKEKHTHQTSGKAVRGPGLVQTYPVMSIRGNILRQRNDRDQSNHPNTHLRMRWARRGSSVSIMNPAVTDHFRSLPTELDGGQEETHPFRPEGEEEPIIKTKGQARRTATRCQRARRRRQVRLFEATLNSSLTSRTKTLPVWEKSS